MVLCRLGKHDWSKWEHTEKALPKWVLPKWGMAVLARHCRKCAKKQFGISTGGRKVSSSKIKHHVITIELTEEQFQKLPEPKL